MSRSGIKVWALAVTVLALAGLPTSVTATQPDPPFCYTECVSSCPSAQQVEDTCREHCGSNIVGDCSTDLWDLGCHASEMAITCEHIE